MIVLIFEGDGQSVVLKACIADLLDVNKIMVYIRYICILLRSCVDSVCSTCVPLMGSV